jgi:hypothetical protein
MKFNKSADSYAEYKKNFAFRCEGSCLDPVKRQMCEVGICVYTVKVAVFYELQTTAAFPCVTA